MPGENSNGKTRNSNWLGVVLAMLVALNVLGFAFYLYFYTGSYRYIGEYMGWPIYRFYPDKLLLPLAFAALISSLLLYFFSWKIKFKPELILLVFLILVGVSAVMLSVEYASTVRPHIVLYGGKTDSFIIQYAAAEAIIHGKNPYNLDFKSVLFDRLAVTKYTFIFKPNSTTYNTSDIAGFVSRFDYPAMAALYYVPPALLHVNGTYWDAIILGIALWAVYTRTRGGSRYLQIAVFLSGLFTFFGPLYIGDPQTGWVAPLMIALAFYDRPLLVGALVGMAASYREQALIFALFLLIIYYREEHLRPLLPKAALAAIITALAVNAPFILASPRAFFYNILIPAKYNLYPKGFGLSSLQLIGVILPRIAYTLLFIGSLGIFLILGFIKYSRLRPYLLALPSLSFILYYRPMPTYYEYFLVLNLIWILIYWINKEEQIDYKEQIDTYKVALYSVLFTLTSIILVYTGSPRELEKYTSELLLAGIDTLVGFLLAVTLIVSLHVYYSRRKPFIIGETHLRKAKLLARFITVSLIIALVIQSLYPNTHILAYTPYFTDADSGVSILAGGTLASGGNPYTNYMNEITRLLAEKRLGAVYVMLPYTRNPVTLENLTSYIDPYARMTYLPHKSVWTIITWMTGSVSLSTFYAPAMGNTIGARVLSGLILSIGFILLVFTAVFSMKNAEKRLERLVILSSALVSMSFFYLATPNESVTAGLGLLSLALAYYVGGSKRKLWRASLAILGWFLASGTASIIAMAMLYSLLPERSEKRSLLYGFTLSILVSLVLGRASAFYTLIYPVMDRSPSFYNLFYPYTGSGLVLEAIGRIALFIGVLFLYMLVSAREELETRHILLLVLLPVFAVVPFTRADTMVYALMYSLAIDLLSGEARLGGRSH